MEQQLELLFEDGQSELRKADKCTKDKEVRRLKIQYGPYRNGRTPFPMIKLHGKWLGQAGFRVGDMVTVEVNQGTLTITKIKA